MGAGRVFLASVEAALQAGDESGVWRDLTVPAAQHCVAQGL